MKTVKYCFAIVKSEVDQRRLPQIRGGDWGPKSPLLQNPCRQLNTIKTAVNLSMIARTFSILQPLSRQHWDGIGCKKNDQPIGVTAHSHYFDNFDGLFKNM